MRDRGATVQQSNEQRRSSRKQKRSGRFVSAMVAAVLALTPFVTVAQDVEMADALHQNGKIYVVVGVIAIIFVGLFVYLIVLDRRLSKLEQNGK